jgi:hypothetical protein
MKPPVPSPPTTPSDASTSPPSVLSRTRNSRAHQTCWTRRRGVSLSRVHMPPLTPATAGRAAGCDARMFRNE